MTTSDAFARYKDLSPQDQRAFDRWLHANMAVALLFFAALMAMALNSSGAPGPATASAMPRDVNGVTGSAARRPSEPFSAYELMIRRTPGELPVQAITDPF